MRTFNQIIESGLKAEELVLSLYMHRVAAKLSKQRLGAYLGKGKGCKLLQENEFELPCYKHQPESAKWCEHCKGTKPIYANYRAANIAKTTAMRQLLQHGKKVCEALQEGATEVIV